VRADFAEPDTGKRRLLTLVSNTTTDEATVRAQLVHLSLVLYGELLEPSDPEIGDALALFVATLGPSSAAATPRQVERAWQLTLFAMLQDPRFLHY
jgi:hypothetical protein